MSTYTRRLAVVDAAQFEGGEESAGQLARKLVGMGYSTTWVPESVSHAMNELGEINETIINPEMLVVQSPGIDMMEIRVGQWVASDYDQTLAVYEDSAFRTLYESSE